MAERKEELQFANDKLLVLDEVKSQFLHVISHEIRTLLYGLLGGVGLLKEFGLPEKMQIFIEILDECLKRPEKFASKTFNISNLKLNGKNAMTLNIVDVKSLLCSIIESNQKNEKKLNLIEISL